MTLHLRGSHCRAFEITRVDVIGSATTLDPSSWHPLGESTILASIFKDCVMHSVVRVVASTAQGMTDENDIKQPAGEETMV